MDLFASVVAAAAGADGPNLWGALGCAVAYATAVFAAVDGLGDYLIDRDHPQLGQARQVLLLKAGSKVAAATITVLAAALVLLLDNNWFALIALSLAFAAIILVSAFVYVNTSRSRPAPDSTSERS